MKNRAIYFYRKQLLNARLANKSIAIAPVRKPIVLIMVFAIRKEFKSVDGNIFQIHVKAPDSLRYSADEFQQPARIYRQFLIMFSYFGGTANLNNDKPSTDQSETVFHFTFFKLYCMRSNIYQELIKSKKFFDLFCETLSN